ncbi:hypothetical protein SLE2022_275450 [Rubroshorea leprosula]
MCGRQIEDSGRVDDSCAINVDVTLLHTENEMGKGIENETALHASHVDWSFISSFDLFSQVGKNLHFFNMYSVQDKSICSVVEWKYESES